MQPVSLLSIPLKRVPQVSLCKYQLGLMAWDDQSKLVPDKEGGYLEEQKLQNRQ